jgi:hypothetical protein
MYLCRKHVKFNVERLEDRDTPGILTVGVDSTTQTLNIVGDNENNDLTIRAVFGVPTSFTLSSKNDQIKGGPLVSGVKNIPISMRDGDDSVTFDKAVFIDLMGNLSVNGGNGANTIDASGMEVAKNVSITNGANASGVDHVSLFDMHIDGSVAINNGNGKTFVQIERDSPGVSTIGGNLHITNGTGTDLTILADTNVGGNVKINNGRGNPADGFAGSTTIGNLFNSSRSTIGGNVSVSYQDGNGILSDGINDTAVLGNVSFNHGTGRFAARFDGSLTKLPVVVRGSVTLLGSGTNQIRVGNVSNPGGLVLKQANAASLSF